MKVWKQQIRMSVAVGALLSITGSQVWAQALPVDRPKPPLPIGAAEFLTLPVQPRPPAPPVTPVPLAPQVPRPGPAPTAMPAGVFAWDAEIKEYDAKLGEVSAGFTFNLTNVSPNEVVIYTVSTSCGCTVARLPQQPWPLPPGTNGAIQVTADLKGKFGTIVKTVTVNTSAGSKMLTVKANIPVPPPQTQVAGQMNRTANQRLALADRQAVFKGDCASCHVEKGKGKLGKDLYVASCGICHDAEHRASMVPDLHAPKQPTSRDYWHNWITAGKVGTLMPAFAEEHGGPLTKTQIASLVDYLSSDFPVTNTVPVAVTVPVRAGQ